MHQDGDDTSEDNLYNWMSKYHGPQVDNLKSLVLDGFDHERLNIMSYNNILAFA